MYKFTMPADKWDETAPDKQAIRLLIMKHQKFREKLAKKKKYYEGEHKILDEAERKMLMCGKEATTKIRQGQPVAIPRARGI